VYSQQQKRGIAYLLPCHSVVGNQHLVPWYILLNALHRQMCILKEWPPVNVCKEKVQNTGYVKLTKHDKEYALWGQISPRGMLL